MDSSIKAKLDANYTVNLVRLSLNSPVGHGKVWVLVEGEDDCKIYPKFFQQDKCRIEQVHGGCSQLEEAIAKLQYLENYTFGIRDADFHHITKTRSLYKNLFYTDCHDIEMTMIQNDTVFENILYEYSLQANVLAIKKNILNEASFVGYVRYYNDINNSSFNFEGLKYGDIITQNQEGNLCLDKSLCLQKLNKCSQYRTITVDEKIIKSFINSNITVDLYQLVNGHDFIKLLACRINFIIKRGISYNDVSKSLRNSYRMDDFKQTKLYSHLVSWQNNLGYNILMT
jgi:hypothetical protein